MIKKKINLFPWLLLVIFSLTMISYSRGQAVSKKTGVLERIVISKGEGILEVKILLNIFTVRRQFELSNPNRLVIDFINLYQIKAARSYTVNYLGVLAIRTGMYQRNTARVVFDMAGQIPPYRIESIENGVSVTFGFKEAPKVVTEEIKEMKVKDAICALQVAPAKANVNDPISIDMGSSQYAQSMEVNVVNPEGTKIESKKLFPDSPQWKTILDKPGEYVFQGKAFNVSGKPSENPCETKVHINFPPTSKLECNPCADYVGKPITLDASGSTDSDGEVVKVDFAVIDETGNLVDSFTDCEKPFTWGKSFEKEGIYKVIALAKDDFGAKSEPARVSVVINPKKARRFLFLVDAGALAARGGETFVGYAAGRIGLLYQIIPNRLDFALSGGGAYVSNVSSWKSFFMADALFNVHLGPVFIGTGAGVTSQFKESVDYSYGEFIANAGYDIFRKAKISGSVFLEGRGPISGIPFEDNYKLMLGFRLLF